MSDYQDFCDSYGGCASDPDFMTNWTMSSVNSEKSSAPSEMKVNIYSFNYNILMDSYDLSIDDIKQVKKYLKIYSDNKFNSQKEANNYITENKLWGEFCSIRSLNDHGEYKDVPGITPKAYRITCEIIKVTKGNGAKLTNYKKY